MTIAPKPAARLIDRTASAALASPRTTALGVVLAYLLLTDGGAGPLDLAMLPEAIAAALLGLVARDNATTSERARAG